MHTPAYTEGVASDRRRRKSLSRQTLYYMGFESPMLHFIRHHTLVFAYVVGDYACHDGKTKEGKKKIRQNRIFL